MTSTPLLNYRHQFFDGRACDLPVGKAVCVGRNYAQHAKELNNPIPEQPLLFLKPSTSFVPLSPSFSLPADAGECHHELEVALLIGQTLTAATAEQARAAIVGISLGLDLTLRDRQQALKTAGHPWEIAKAFDGALPLAPFLAANEVPDLTALEFALQVNGDWRQRGNTADMLTPMLPLLVYMSRIFTLLPGDVVMTGTPAGVAALHSGDELVLTLADRARFTTRVA